jgi:polyisoprenoid-binding protein YceI
MSTTTHTRSSTRLPVGRWESDQTHSMAGFAIRAVGTFRGSFANVTATLTVAEDGHAQLVGSVAADSIQVKNDRLKNHLSSPDFFDVANYPELRFDSSTIRRDGDCLELDGELTIRDQTRPITAHGTVTEPITALDGSVRVGIALAAAIDRTDYGVSWNAPLPNGGTAIGTEVTITVDLDLTLTASDA